MNFRDTKTSEYHDFRHGDAGIGKSAFVQKICKVIAENRAYVISGKCQSDIGYGAFITGFKKSIKQ